MLHKNVLIKARVQELKEQLAVITKRKSRKRKQIQHSGTLEYGPAASRIEREQCQDREQLGLSRQALARCKRCRETGHNSRTCKKDI
ncbi:uncharacterized protein M421DRAFT_410079, partial [Didymella exigua CBS 183.55]